MYTLNALLNDSWVNLMPNSNNISYSSNSDSMTMQLSFDTIYEFGEGTHIIFKNDDIELFRGIAVKKNKKRNINNYTCLDYAFYLNKNDTIIQFNNIPASSAIEQLLESFGISHSITFISTPITKIYKKQKLNSIIDDILQQSYNELSIKYIREMQGNVLCIDTEESFAIESTAKFQIGKNVEINSSIEKMQNKILVVSNEEKNNSILATVEDTSSIVKYGQLQEIISVDKKDIAQAANIAKNNLNDKNKVSFETPLNLLITSGGDDIKPHRLIRLDIDYMSMSGLYKIKSATHNLNKNKHTANITVEW